MRHTITEHHYCLNRGSWTAEVGHTTNVRKTTTALAEQRRTGDLPATLSHWTIGTKRVAGQSASRLFDRQMDAKTAFFDSLGDAIE